MKKSTQTTLALILLCGLFIAGFAGRALGNGAIDADTSAIMASPQMIVLAKVSQVTIHTNIPASSVDYESVELNGVVPTGLWADNLGHLVARFAVADLALEPGPAILTLTGVVDEEIPFVASDEVSVK